MSIDLFIKYKVFIKYLVLAVKCRYAHKVITTRETYQLSGTA